LNFPEGPAWDGKGSLYVSNCYGGWIAKIGPGGGSVFLRASRAPFTFERTNGLTVFRDGSLFACDFGRGAILRIDLSKGTEVYADQYQGVALQSPNDLAFDPAGNLYFTHPSAMDPNNRDGAIYRIGVEDRTITRVAGELAYPNGISFSADAQELYVAESALSRILKFHVFDDGLLEDPQVFAELTDGEPDGINLDLQGNLWIANWGTGCVYVVSPEGKIIRRIPTPGDNPTNVEFGGPDLKTLYLTEVETGGLYKMEVEVPGLKLFSSPGN
jgi:gluconolactonase